MRVVYEDRILAHIGDLDDAQQPVGTHDHTLVAVDSEADRLPVLQVDHHLLAHLTAGDVVERAVVEHVAVLEDLDERRALVGVGLAEDVHHVLAVEIVGTSNEAGLGAQRDRERVEGRIDGTERRALGDLADLGCRRVLAFRQPVDAVVEQQDRQVDVAPQRMDEVVAADRQTVAVARDDPHIEVGPSDSETGGDGRGTTVNAMHAVGVHVVREPAAAADPADEHRVLRGDAEVGHELLHGQQDAVVTTTRAPTHLLVAGPVLLRRDRHDGVAHFNAPSMASSSSRDVNGKPCTLETDLASMR